MNSLYIPDITFYKIIKMLKDRNNISHEKIAEGLNITDSTTISKWVNGDRKYNTLRKDRYEKLLKFLKTTFKEKYSYVLCETFPALVDYKDYPDILDRAIIKSLDKNYNSSNWNTVKNVQKKRAHKDDCDFERITENAKNGDPASMYELGMLYYHGNASVSEEKSEQDFTKATFWLKQAAQSDNAEIACHALTSLGRMYYAGEIPFEQQSYEKSFECYKRAEVHDLLAFKNVAYMLRCGTGCKIDINAVFDHYQEREKYRKYEYESAMACAAFLADHGKLQEALEIYTSIEAKTNETHYQMGLLHLNMFIESQSQYNYENAKNHFIIAANSHHIEAAYQYGIICFRPIYNAPTNFLEAEKYLKIAADAGHATAAYVYGFMLKSGHLTRNLPLAAEYLEKARAAGSTFAAYELSLLYQQSDCQDFQKALECSEMAAANGSAEAALVCGNLYYWGRGCNPDVEKAFKMYTAASQGGVFFADLMIEKIKAAIAP